MDMDSEMMTLILVGLCLIVSFLLGKECGSNCKNKCITKEEKK